MRIRERASGTYRRGAGRRRWAGRRKLVDGTCWVGEREVSYINVVLIKVRLREDERQSKRAGWRHGGLGQGRACWSCRERRGGLGKEVERQKARARKEKKAWVFIIPKNIWCDNVATPSIESPPLEHDAP